MKPKFPTFKHFLLIFLFYILFSIPAGVPMLALQSINPALGMLLAYITATGLTIWATMRYFNRKAKFNFKPSHLMLLPLVVLTAYAFLIVGEFTVELLPEPTGVMKKLFDNMNKTFEMVFQHKILGFLTIAVAAPLLEEMLFRGIILRALLKKTKPWKAILFTAIAFGIFHGNPWQFLYATVVGIYLGYLYWRTQSLFYPILVHFVLNGTAFVSAALMNTNPEDGLVEQVGSMNTLYVMVVLALGFIYINYLLFEKQFSLQKKHLVLATQNQHKIQEIKKILPDNMVLQSLGNIGFKGELKETGTTLEQNALQKMWQIARPYDVDALADDTGLEVDALDGAPGVYSARYAGEKASYQDNVDKLLQEMQGVTNRQARFRTVIALSIGDKEFTVEGKVNGHITEAPRGVNGFGYDSVFVPEGQNLTFAEMTDEQKNTISHRGRALQKLKDILKELKVNTSISSVTEVEG